jgi:hypothetical protein
LPGEERIKRSPLQTSPKRGGLRQSLILEVFWLWKIGNFKMIIVLKKNETRFTKSPFGGFRGL